MFSGIVEATGKITNVKNNPGTTLISITRPENFNDLLPGHSVCVNGICLTIENLYDREMEFSLAAETLKVTEWGTNDLLGKFVNLERSLQFGGRVHGHLVTGHVESLTKILKVEDLGGSRVIYFSLPVVDSKYIIAKGSVAINGVSLTVNDVDAESFSVCLIPETLKRTNLGQLQVNDRVCLETDYLIRSVGKIWQ